MLRNLPSNFFHVCITSPPYYGLRSYQGDQDVIWGGDSNCAHVWGDAIPGSNRGGSGTPTDKNNRGEGYARGEPKGRFCQLCNAWRGGLGAEPLVDLYVDHLVEVFREAKRVLRPDGVFWCNISDSYASGKGTMFNPGGGENSLPGHALLKEHGAYQLDKGNKSVLTEQGLKPLDKYLVPFQLAIALQNDGWYVRQDCIWEKSNGLPESVHGTSWIRHRVKDNGRWLDCSGCDMCTPNDGLVLRRGAGRPSKRHEYILMLTKTPCYYYDDEAVRNADMSSVPPRESNGRVLCEQVSENGSGRDLSSVPQRVPAPKVSLGSGTCQGTRVVTFTEREGESPQVRDFGQEQGCSAKVSAVPKRETGAGEVLSVAKGERDQERVREVALSATGSSGEDEGELPTPQQDRTSQNIQPEVLLHPEWAVTQAAEGQEVQALAIGIDGCSQKQREAPQVEAGRVDTYSSGVARDKGSVSQSLFLLSRGDQTDDRPSDSLEQRRESHERQRGPQLPSVQCSEGGSVDSSCSSGHQLGSVWTFPTRPFSGGHYAAFAPRLPEICVRASTSEQGCCPKCGLQYARVIEISRTFQSGSGRSGNKPLGKNSGEQFDGDLADDIRAGPCVSVKTVDWKPTCSCNSGAPVPARVLDFFSGAGTTAMVCEELHRDSVNIDISVEYNQIAKDRLTSAEQKRIERMLKEARAKAKVLYRESSLPPLTNRQRCDTVENVPKD